MLSERFGVDLGPVNQNSSTCIVNNSGWIRFIWMNADAFGATMPHELVLIILAYDK